MADVVPTNEPQWNESLSNVVEPGSSRKLSGYAPGEVIPAGAFNWIVNFWAQWIRYLWARVQTYSTLQSLYAGLADTNSGPLGEYVTDYWGQQLATQVDGTARAAVLSGNGPYLVVATATGHPRVIARTTAQQSGGATTVRTLTRNNASDTNSAIKCRGDLCAVAAGNRVDLFTLSTGVRAWSYNHGATVYDVDIVGDQVVFGGATSGGVRLGKIAIFGGTLTYSADPGATVYSVSALPDGRVAAMGSTSTSFGGTHGLALYKADLSGTSWTRSSAAICSALPRCLANDGLALYTGGTTGAVNRVSLYDGSSTWSAVLVSGSTPVRQVVVDHGGVFVIVDDAAGDFGHGRLDKRSGGIAWRYYNPSGSGLTLQSLYADGAGVFVGVDLSQSLTSYVRGNRPGIFQRVTGTTALRTAYPWLTQPIGEE